MWLADAVRASYAWVFDACGGDPVRLFSVGLNAWGLVIFWGLGGLYLLADLTSPAFMTKYKVQPGEHQPLSRPNLLKALKRCSFNMFVVGSLFSLAFGYLAIHVRGNPYLPEDIVFDWRRMARDGVVIALMEELGFYTFTAPIAISAVYAHPLEHVLANLGPIALGPLVCGCHVWFIFLWVSIALTQTLHVHSGYHLPFVTSSEKHDFHHKYFNVNYGPIGLLDWYFATDTKFRNHVASKRHFMLRGMTPARELIPDPPA
ncbi:Fatty acid hydroxylase domain-containing protein 2, partial [Durusdinium trenchii]